MGRVLLEVCVDSVESVREAAKGGAGRIELCSALSEGGLTPTVGLLRTVKQIIEPKIPVFAMLRPRRGNDFCFSDDEMAVMLLDLEVLKEAGADGFVFGALTERGEIDIPNCRRIIQAAGSLPVTFHRAFDVTEEAKSAETCAQIADLGFCRLLTSGFRTSAEEGMQRIKLLNEKFRQRLVIMPGAGVTDKNAKKIIDETDCQEIHASARLPKSQETSEIPMGSASSLEPLLVTSSSVVERIVKNLQM
ncbi:copper homeostasis protein cutC homolog [Phlebotomus argentipes]|uniref:copper homeostasis protein cutC homolog n=1 Tax=Phlebotomus argentipes TaxID=94469 RepID=UPI002892F515|nr:copper homeostasis protein cutC homolog [Phlebotomus argentipes]